MSRISELTSPGVGGKEHFSAFLSPPSIPFHAFKQKRKAGSFGLAIWLFGEDGMKAVASRLFGRVRISGMTNTGVKVGGVGWQAGSTSFASAGCVPVETRGGRYDALDVRRPVVNGQIHLLWLEILICQPDPSR